MAKNRLKIQPNEMLPPLPSPQVLCDFLASIFFSPPSNGVLKKKQFFVVRAQELKPFPSSRCLKYTGHTVWRVLLCSFSLRAAQFECRALQNCKILRMNYTDYTLRTKFFPSLWTRQGTSCVVMNMRSVQVVCNCTCARMLI